MRHPKSEITDRKRERYHTDRERENTPYDREMTYSKRERCNTIQDALHPDRHRDAIRP